MFLITLKPIHILIIILSSFVVIGVLILLFRRLYQKRLIKKNLPKLYYKTVRKVTDYNDYYLINLFTLTIDNKTTLVYDHLLFGDKYIYVIKDVYYIGKLHGERKDLSWRLVSKKDEKEQFVNNPTIANEYLVEKLSLSTGIDKDVFISIILFNDECDIFSIQNDIKNSYIINRKDLMKLISATESRDIRPFNKKQLQGIVEDIDKLNERKVTKKAKK